LNYNFSYEVGNEETIEKDENSFSVRFGREPSNQDRDWNKIETPSKDESHPKYVSKRGETSIVKKRRVIRQRQKQKCAR